MKDQIIAELKQKGIKFITFISQLHRPSDGLRNKFLYQEVSLLDNEHVLFGETVAEIASFKTIYNEYIKRGFIYEEHNLYKIL